MRNQQHSAKVLNSEFYLCPRLKSQLQNYLIDLQDFLTQTAHMEDTFLNMAAESAVPVPSGTHSTLSLKETLTHKK